MGIVGSCGRRWWARATAATAAAVALASFAACASSSPQIDGVAGAPPTPRDVWQAPSSIPPAPGPTAALPDTLAALIGAAGAAGAAGAGGPTGVMGKPAAGAGGVQELRLDLADVVGLALRNNPATRLSWAQSRAAAAAYGVRRGELFPEVDVGATATDSKTLSTAVRFGGERRQVNPTVSLSYLLFDLGGRSGARDEAKEGAFAAGFGHNSTLQNVVLAVERAYFDYMGTKSLLEAQRLSVQEAETSLDAAQHRHDVGLATIADVLQAKTALSQAKLTAETTQGELQATRAALAVAMGLPANVPYDVAAPSTDSVKVQEVATSVDTLIAQAVRGRPDLAAAEAQARGAGDAVRQVRSDGLPALRLNGSAGQVYSDVDSFSGGNWAVSLSLQFPVFTGLSQSYAVQGAEAQATAALARAEGLRQQVVQQVFTSYYALQTATQRVRTADDLLASATQSEEVARGRYREGVGTIVDLLTAQRALADARAQQAQARWTWLSSLSLLAHDVGVLGPDGNPRIPLAPAASPGPN